MRQPASHPPADPARSPTLSIADRLALRPAEAAQVLGISERTLRTWLPRMPHLRLGSTVLIPVEELRTWLGDRARGQQADADALADEIIRELGAR